MLTLSLNTLPRDANAFAAQLAKVRSRQPPAFATYSPDYQRLYSLAGKYASITNFVVIGQGDGVRAFKAIYTALAKYHTTKKVSIVETLDPDHVAYVRQKYRQEDTLVIIVAEKGDDPIAIQGLLAFQEYKKVMITGEGPLAQFASMKEIEFLKYPAGGSYVAGTEAALLPAAIIYIDVNSLVNGMLSVYRQCDPSRAIDANPALQLAAALAAAEQRGCSEIVVQTYSHTLVGAGTLLSGLLAGEGQSVCFGTNCQLTSRHAELFLRIEKPGKEIVLSAEYQLSGVQGISNYAGVKLSEAVAKRYADDRKVADESHIPNATITIDVLNPGTLGELLGFWQYVSLYGAWLRE